MKPLRVVRVALVLAVALLAAAGLSGCVWSDPQPLNSNASTDSGDDEAPQVVTDGAGNWVAVWMSQDDLGGTIDTETDVLVARSTDKGATWTPPAALNTNAATDLWGDNRPQVTTDGGGNWLAVWESDNDLGDTIGTDSDILMARSTDNGATWTDPAALNTNAVTDSGWDGYPQVTTDGGGHWVAVWESHQTLGGTIGEDLDILVARSTDNGATWTPPVALNTNAATDSGWDEKPQVTTDGGGNWLAVWHSWDDPASSFGTDGDILVARSTDNGITWTPPTALNTNAATDSGWDEYPQVTTDGGGNWLAVWHSYDSLGGTIDNDGDILVARSTDNGATWTSVAPLNTNAATDWGRDELPQVTTDGRGNWVAVWHSEENLGGGIGYDWDILMARSIDNGATWTVPDNLNFNAATDSGEDSRPQVTTDGEGNWVAVWQSNETLGGTIGEDWDILVARSRDSDGDGRDNDYDNCPEIANSDQGDWDGDGLLGTQPPPYATWGGDACDDSDSDSKSQGAGAGFFRDSVELFIGTDPADACADTSAANDETGAGVSPWPPDFNDNGLLDIGDLVALRNHWVPLGEQYGVRYDLNANGLCDIGDLVVLRTYWSGSGHDTCTVG
jgi:hypothetical protein